MQRVIRFTLLSITTILSLILVLGIIVASFWYIQGMARERTSSEPYEITASNIERVIIGLYLRFQGDVASQPVNPYDDTPITFVIEPGQSVASVSNSLQREGLIADAEVFRRVVQYHGVDADIQVGAYVLRRNMTMQEIMEKLQRGLIPGEMVTTVEGWRLEQIAQVLEDRGVTLAEDFLALAQDTDAMYENWPFLADRPEGSPQGLEGFLFPDTYQLPRDTSAEGVIEIMLRNFDWRVTKELRDTAEASGMSLYEVITLASIVEREAVVPEERDLIASVFLNRLAAQMPLQADPTVQYSLGCDVANGECWQQLTRADLNSVQSPYNTYLHPGLPPGPICNPGLAAIRAVLEPADTRYLFFVATDDGRHIFSETYEEHLIHDAARTAP